MASYLLHKNPVTGVEHWVHDDEGQNKVVQTTYDRQPFLEHAAQMRNEVKQSTKGMVKIGTIPATLYFQWMREGKLGEIDKNGVAYEVNPEKIRALLNSPEYKLLKTVDGQA